MEQYIPKATVVAEITKLQLCTMDEHMNYYSAEAQGEYNALSKLESFLDTLEVKEVDLEKELDKEWNKCEPIDEGMGLEIASIEHEQFDNIAKHFFELGLKAKKNEG